MMMGMEEREQERLLLAEPQQAHVILQWPFLDML
jgi:hypothetical protein